MADNNENNGLAGQEADTERSKPLVVGIGASAGGIQALQLFFGALPERTGLAFVVVVHLDPQGRSELSSILGARTRMPVRQVTATETLCADHVYVIAPDRRLQITDSEIAAVAFDEPRGQRAPIDLFFRSLAEQHGDGFAVILTGAGSDGSVGVRAVKEAGGIILVQDPNEAEFPSMPRSAIATGIADFVLPVHELAERLVELVHNRQTAAIPDEQRVDEELLQRILAHVRVRTGHDFSKYKRSTVLRRVARRMQITRSENLPDYFDFLRDHADEAQALLGDLLISVTTFFRDAEAFESLKIHVIKRIFEGRTGNESIRVWVPGCATGEEAYSIAMLLLEEAATRDVRPTLQVFGSDLDANALAVAREGRFPVAIQADVSEDRLRRFFQREGEHYRVRRELRDVVLFASHSLLKDPPFSRIDLISCRNLLIYLNRGLQQQACMTFHYALNPHGYLLLGASETADYPPGLFHTIDRKSRIYQATGLSKDKPMLLSPLLTGIDVRDHAKRARRETGAGSLLSEAAVHREAIEKLAPPSILVDHAHHVVHLSETVGRYLQPAGGPLTGDVVDLVRPEIRFELRSALHRALEHGQPTLSLPIMVRFNGAAHRVHFQVSPMEELKHLTSRSAVVMFLEGEAVDAESQPVNEAGRDRDETVRRLTEELQVTQQRLRTTREESEAANEELRAANEELQSINEEYRSTSEELETSKEELQSINEELQTVNSELKLKLEVVSRAHSDLQNLMAATDFGTLFLDSALRIKRFTEPVTALFRITPSDEGRPLSDFAHLLEYDGLIADAHAVLSQLAPIKRELRSREKRWYDVRLRPYRTLDDKIDGVVITFIDITERRQVEEALRDSEQRLSQVQRLLELSGDPIFIWDAGGEIVEWNRGCEQLYGYTRQEALGGKAEELLQTSVLGSSMVELRTRLSEQQSWSGELRQRSKSGGDLVVETNIVLRDMGGRRLALESGRDITERKQWEKRQTMLLAELSHRIKNTLAVVQAIAHQSLRRGSSEDFIQRFDGRLAALARAHDLLVQSQWEGADLATLARSQLEPYASENPKRLKIEGQPITLFADIATPLGLVLHELATNAAKYGSLSVQDGIVDVTWTLLTPRNGPLVLTLVWREKNGPPISRPDSNGFGSALIESGIPQARVSRDFRHDGLVCTIELTLPEAPQVQ